MLSAAFWVLCAASILGAGLVALYLGANRRPPAAVQTLHAALGAASLALLLDGLHRGLPASTMGTGGFAPAAAGLLALALAVGLALARAAWRRRRPQEFLVGTHASLAIAALVVLLALIALG